MTTHTFRNVTGLFVAPRWITGLLLTLLIGGLMMSTGAVPIAGLPRSVERAYDVTWTVLVTGNGTEPLTLSLEGAYRLSITPHGWRWEGNRPAEATTGMWTLPLEHPSTLTIKRRSGQVALLLDHRLVHILPVFTDPHGNLAMGTVPGWARIDEVRYVPVGPRQFGDDFMRPEGREKIIDYIRNHQTFWFEDTTWQVARYRKDWPGEDPRDPATGKEMTIPWQLGVMLNTRTTPNGFWYLYTGTGPSWVVAHPLMVPPSWDRYYVEAAVKPEYDSTVGLIAAYQSNEQYLIFRWEQQAKDAGPRATLYAVIDGHPQLLATVRVGFQPRQWYRMRMNLGWEQLEVWIDGVKVLTAPNPGLIEGRVGLFADGAANPQIPDIDQGTTALYTGTTKNTDPSWTLQMIPCVYFDDVLVGDWEASMNSSTSSAISPSLPEQLMQDAWSQTFAGAEALWSPAVLPATAATSSGQPRTVVGVAAPFPTDQPGLYWHKGRHYHNFSVTVPLSGVKLNGQTVHLTNGDVADGGYRVVLTSDHGHGNICVFRRQVRISTYRFLPKRWTSLVITRQGSELRLTLAASEEAGAKQEAAQVLLRYHDPQPLSTPQVGVTVTDASLPAARLQVASDWRQETFATAPTAWHTTHGMWGVMTRYSCDPRWNWFGGYGATTPTAWTKALLLGDQTVEVYLGIKMEYDNLPHESAKRFRDLNLSICTDGIDPNSGYTLTRGHPVDGKPMTQLLRRGQVVWSSTDPADLMPTPKAGYRAWSALRLVKTGATVTVYLDNRLAGAYTDTEPISCGHAAIWTVNNGIVIGRVNYSAAEIRPTLENMLEESK